VSLAPVADGSKRIFGSAAALTIGCPEQLLVIKTDAVENADPSSKIFLSDARRSHLARLDRTGIAMSILSIPIPS
jgi:hypothetical protein